MGLPYAHTFLGTKTSAFKINQINFLICLTCIWILFHSTNKNQCLKFLESFCANGCNVVYSNHLHVAVYSNHLHAGVYIRCCKSGVHSLVVVKLSRSRGITYEIKQKHF